MPQFFSILQKTAFPGPIRGTQKRFDFFKLSDIQIHNLCTPLMSCAKKLWLGKFDKYEKISFSGCIKYLTF